MTDIAWTISDPIKFSLYMGLWSLILYYMRKSYRQRGSSEVKKRLQLRMALGLPPSGLLYLAFHGVVIDSWVAMIWLRTALNVYLVIAGMEVCYSIGLAHYATVSITPQRPRYMYRKYQTVAVVYSVLTIIFSIAATITDNALMYTLQAIAGAMIFIGLSLIFPYRHLELVRLFNLARVKSASSAGQEKSPRASQLHPVKSLNTRLSIGNTTTEKKDQTFVDMTLQLDQTPRHTPHHTMIIPDSKTSVFIDPSSSRMPSTTLKIDADKKSSNDTRRASEVRSLQKSSCASPNFQGKGKRSRRKQREAKERATLKTLWVQAVVCAISCFVIGIFIILIAYISATNPEARISKRYEETKETYSVSSDLGSFFVWVLSGSLAIYARQ
mmetsp:Transcript_17712/g.26528  ORF Transcript_17712/g.26528 Transcript_17712/m.26528 type:complete len:384 (-) Transcript_17712:172-1323(-)